jgi:CHAT domain-containing protein
VLADPVFDSSDERLHGTTQGAAPNTAPVQARGLGLVTDQVTKAAKESGVLLNGLSIPRLPGTRREADAIMRLVPSSEGKEALGLEASRQTATSEELSHYRYLHFATHGFLDSQQPELSGIVLSMVDANGQPQDGFLRAHEIFNLKLPAEMVVLSACETGLGKDVKGEGIIGLTRGFMYAGAPRVVVSLWSVNDTATAELMARFYKGIFVGKMRPAQALQAAQVSMLGEARYSAPFYWAAFTLQGEWK